MDMKVGVMSETDFIDMVGSSLAEVSLLRLQAMDEADRADMNTMLGGEFAKVVNHSWHYVLDKQRQGQVKGIEIGEPDVGLIVAGLVSEMASRSPSDLIKVAGIIYAAMTFILRHAIVKEFDLDESIHERFNLLEAEFSQGRLRMIGALLDELASHINQRLEKANSDTE